MSTKSSLQEFIPTEHGWHVNFDKQFDPQWRPFSRPRFRQLVEYVPLFMRYLRIWYRLKRAKRRAHMDFINPIPLQQIYGSRLKRKKCLIAGFVLFRCSIGWYRLWNDRSRF